MIRSARLIWACCSSGTCDGCLVAWLTGRDAGRDRWSDAGRERSIDGWMDGLTSSVFLRLCLYPCLSACLHLCRSKSMRANRAEPHANSEQRERGWKEQMHGWMDGGLAGWIDQCDGVPAYLRVRSPAHISLPRRVPAAGVESISPAFLCETAEGEYALIG